MISHLPILGLVRVSNTDETEYAENEALARRGGRYANAAGSNCGIMVGEPDSRGLAAGINRTGFPRRRTGGEDLFDGWFQVSFRVGGRLIMQDHSENITKGDGDIEGIWIIRFKTYSSRDARIDLESDTLTDWIAKVSLDSSVHDQETQYAPLLETRRPAFGKRRLSVRVASKLDGYLEGNDAVSILTSL